ncbi:phosphopantothenate/pantothenate synthetase [Candidatus Geothermarchaeota archaeon ex4572_27]|nr:MAG: phosphopantothenate/pantothenate synthetase [Candidatus Geothermarchaeota archaeon ex4572_27]
MHWVIPRSHPRYESLVVRERLVEAFEKGVVVPQGLIAHGRGEAFDYILGERTWPPAEEAIRAAAAMLLTAEYPVISVNGNTAALVPGEVVRLAEACGARIEVNLFYRSEARERAIRDILQSHGAGEVLGVGEDASARIPELMSERRRVSPRGIYRADVVLLAIEDGDRTEALVKMGKKVIAIDINPFSRTARAATVTIVDNIVRAMPRLIEEVERLKAVGREEIEAILRDYDNDRVLREMVGIIRRRLEAIEREGWKVG